MSIIGKVDSLWRYPVKSMRGEELDEFFVGEGGIEGDRLFAFRSSIAPANFPYFTARQQHEMLRYRPRLAPKGDSGSPNEWSVEVETPAQHRGRLQHRAQRGRYVGEPDAHEASYARGTGVAISIWAAVLPCCHELAPVAMNSPFGSAWPGVSTEPWAGANAACRCSLTSVVPPESCRTILMWCAC